MTIQAINKLPWPENLLRLLFMDEEYDKWKAQIPPDFDESFKYILEETLTERETYILYSFFRDRIHMQIIGQRYGIQAERVRQIKDKAIRRIRHPSRMKYLSLGLAEVERLQREPPEEKPAEKCTIDELDLDVRAFNCVLRAGVRTIEDLTRLSRSDLLKVRNMGVRTIDEVERKLEDKGLALRQEDEIAVPVLHGTA